MKSATESSEQTAPAIPAEHIRAALEKILASPGFITADRLTRFLRYVVDETLDGQPDKLKESLLGIEVFNRRPAYDPRVDAVVRTEAVKLRARLKDYYETEGREDPVVIDMPKGGYVPAFRVREQIAEAPPVLPPAAAPDPRDLWKSAAAGVAVIAILAGSLWFATRKGAHPVAGELSSIAVLPFADLSPQHDQEYFCDGITEEIIDSLTKVGGFRVVARTSSFAFKGKQQDIREIGHKLNVNAVLEGSVRKSGNTLRITAQLNSVADGYHLWSETYERELQDVFHVQDEISQAIVNTLQLKLAPDRNAAHPKPNTANLEAYDLYLKGRYHWARWRTEGAEKALHYFEQAIAKDPNYASAYAGLADSYCWLGFFSAQPPNQVMPKAKAAALKAIELDGSLPSAHASLAYVNALYDFDWPAAEREFTRAIQLNPGLADGHFGYGIAYLTPKGKYPEAIRELQIARDIDPLSLAANTYLGLAYQLNGNGALAQAFYKKALELDPNFFEAHSSLASAYMQTRQWKLFDAELDAAGGETAACRIELVRAVADAFQGRTEQALAIAHRWEHPPPGIYVRPTAIANVYAALGDREQTILWLQKAYQERDGMLAYILRDRPLQAFRSDPRFQELIRQIGLQ